MSGLIEMTANHDRRRLLTGIATAAAAGVLRPLSAAAALLPTPAQTSGPFYPLTLPLDSDNDLVQVAGQAASAAGTITHVGGRVLDLNGRAVPSARVEIWQCDANGRYHNVRDRNPGTEDPGFQGYGQTLTAADGGYRFRTIRPVAYPGRTPHIHFKISGNGFDSLTTQLYVADEPRNDGDGVLNSIDATARQRVIVPFLPAPEIEDKALKAAFDIVLGDAG
jgi:protocatechuate 3,4-dioxygenase beta subunit